MSKNVGAGGRFDIFLDSGKTIKVYSLANIVSMLSSLHEFRLALGAIDAVLVCC